MGHERENGSEYPGGQNSRTPDTRLFRDVFEIEYILYETETQSYENREEHSFFHGIDEGERTSQDTEVLARLFYQGYDDIVKKHELECSEYRSSDGDSSIRKGRVKNVEPKKQKVKK